jgi:hypothetical protein
MTCALRHTPHGKRRESCGGCGARACGHRECTSGPAAAGGRRDAGGGSSATANGGGGTERGCGPAEQGAARSAKARPGHTDRGRPWGAAAGWGRRGRASGSPSRQLTRRRPLCRMATSNLVQRPPPHPPQAHRPAPGQTAPARAHRGRLAASAAPAAHRFCHTSVGLATHSQWGARRRWLGCVLGTAATWVASTGNRAAEWGRGADSALGRGLREAGPYFFWGGGGSCAAYG